VKKKYQSEALMVCHQDAVGLHQLGLIDDAKMREFDEGCLVPEPKAPSAQKTLTPVHAHPLPRA
jgi:DNA-binding transcriptional regulator YiaG